MARARSTSRPLHVPLEEFEGKDLAQAKVTVLDSIHEDGPKLVRLPQSTALELATGELGLRLVRVRKDFTPAWTTLAASTTPLPASGSLPWKVEVTDKGTGRPVEGAVVTIWKTGNTGDQQVTDASGHAYLRLPPGTTLLDKWTVVAPLSGCWSWMDTHVPIHMFSPGVCSLQPVNVPHGGVFSYHYPAAIQGTEGAGVKVAVIDTGVDMSHSALQVVTGENTVKGESINLCGDNGLGHGTHVAGLICASSSAWKALAPGAEVQSWRVFAQGSGFATNYAILKAIMHAQRARVDIINLSLSNSSLSGYDQALASALDDAADDGVLVIAAAGNDGQANVSPLARLVAQHGLVVGAVGRRGTYPRDSVHTDEETSAPRGADPDDFVAAFSNFGNDISLVAPGTAICSTVPGNRFGVMSGTSMACPIVSAIAARVLAANSTDPALANRNRARTQRLMQLVVARAGTLGFGFLHEGSGLALP